MLNRLINTKVAGGGGCTDIVDNYDPFGGNGVALYQLNGDATDESGNYNGTASNVTYGTGIFGQAGVFNGSSSKITTSLTQTNTGAWSWSFWVNISAKPSAGNIAAILSNINGAAPFAGVTFLIDSPNFGIASNGSNIWTTNTINPSLSTWYHIAITYNGSGTITPYINGQSYGAISHTPSNGNTITIGDSDVSSWGSFNGSIDQVRVFNTALTPLEVEALYTEQLCICDGTVDTLDILGDGSCIATYQLDGNANDLSGNYSGTPTDVSYGVGEFDLAGVFNGTSSKISLPNVMSFSTGEHTISSWLYIQEANEKRFISNFHTGTIPDGSVDLVYSNPDNAIFIDFRIGTNYTNTIPNPPTNQWIHIVATFVNNGICSAYLNGSLIDTVTAPSFTATSYQPLNLGYYPRSATYFKGSLDQVRIFNKALSAGEVTTLYNETACDALACSGTTNTLHILGDGSCVATYPLDGSPADLSGNYNGVQTNVTYPQGYFDLAGSFNGSSSGINLPSSLNTSVIDATGAFSISMWINANDISTNQYLFCPNNSNNVDLGINTNDRGVGKIVWTIYNTSYSYLISTTTITTNTWYNIAVTYNNGLSELFINGVSQGTITKTLLESSIEPTLGYRNTGGSVRYNGSIDQVRIFNKALNSTEVGILYNNETPCN